MRLLSSTTVWDQTAAMISSFETTSPGTGDFAGFYARVTVNCPNFPSTGLCSLDGTYSFGDEDDDG